MFRYVLLAGVTIMFVAGPSTSQAQEEKSEAKWIQLFNGKDLSGWQVKIRRHELGDNFANTFRVEDGLLKVRYDGYERFNETFGHLFYEKPFSHYILRAEYRFVGEQCPGGPGWALRNSGFMLHGQDPTTMTKNQDFPASIEVQLLGRRDTPTANLCTPSTHVVMNGKLLKRHCTNSKSEIYPDERWVTVEIEVRGNEVMRHKMEGKVVLEYQRPQLDQNDAAAKRLLADGRGVMLDRGTISLQSESHPIDFRKVELLDLSGDDEK